MSQSEDAFNVLSSASLADLSIDVSVCLGPCHAHKHKHTTDCASLLLPLSLSLVDTFGTCCHVALSFALAPTF